MTKLNKARMEILENIMNNGGGQYYYDEYSKLWSYLGFKIL